ncbi:hypothetical protein PVAP13_5NG470786 [Panicum virgatum]|uniref:Uncharacterized protein n=1 Tax=Panicum virgatum TaxID=38727 RepID=A0A8T0S0V0_PANVG|nr:hypothetical protein PVAP13_5NG470786 [Panicum virgatum]
MASHILGKVRTMSTQMKPTITPRSRTKELIVQFNRVKAVRKTIQICTHQQDNRQYCS